MERPQKRIKLINPTDPSIPPEDGGSPFLESRDAVAFSVFKTLSAHGEKNKMKMGLVCRSFESLIENRLSWEGENRLKLDKDEENITINGYKFSYEKASAALSKLLDRITVKKLVLGEMSDVPEEVIFGLSHAIAKHKNFVNLKSIQFLEFDRNAIINTAIATCGFENVTKIECGDWGNIQIDSLPLQFYPILLCCPELTTFTLGIGDILPVWGRLFLALAHSNNISALTIQGYRQETNLSHQTAIEFARSCSSTFPKLTSFHFWPPIDAFEPSEFLDALSEPFLSKMISFGIALNPEIHSHRECLQTISHRFPNLKHLAIIGTGGFSTETVLDAIGNIFENYSGRRRTDVYDFKFFVQTKNCAEVIYKLVTKKWNDDDEFVKIEGENGTWKCIKDKVRISLSLK